MLITPAFAAGPVIHVTDFAVCDGAAEGAATETFDASGCERSAPRGPDPQGRLIWLRAEVKFDDLKAIGKEPYGVFTGALASREIWWNGVLIGSVGTPGAARAEEQPGFLDDVTYIPPDIIRTENILALKMSSFHNPIRVRQPVHFVMVAPYGSPRPAIFLFYAPAILTAGALIAAAIYFGAAFAADRRDAGSLLIVLMSLFAVAQLAIESLRGLVPYPYSLQVWRLIAVAVLAFGFALSMAAYAARRFQRAHWRRFVATAALITLAAAPFGPGFDGKALFALIGPSLVAFVAAFLGARKKIPGAAVAAIALAIFVALMFVQGASFLDIAYYYAAAGLAVVFFVDQLGALQRARAAETEARTRAAALELELVKRRIAPHFLMNALNALADWIESDPKTGVKMIDALAGEFRLLSQVSGRALIPLADEIALCRRHLEVMSYRTDRAFSLKADGVDERRAVPPGIIHTLVENAFSHGRFADGAEFLLREEASAASVALELTTPAAESAGKREEDGGETGEGLSYVRRRLEAAFGASAQVDGGPAANGGWRTVLTWPKPAA